MSAVIFTKLHSAYSLGGALHVCDVTSRKCISTPGKTLKKIAHIECEEVPHALFGNAIKDFVSQWETQSLHPMAAKREVALWGSFFASRRDFSYNPRRMEIQRNANELSFFRAEVIGHGQQISILSKDAFNLNNGGQVLPDLSEVLEKEIEELQRNGFRIKDKVAIYGKKTFALSSIGFEWETQKSLAYCLETNDPMLKVLNVHPLSMARFSLAPSVAKMTLKVDTCDSSIYQYFSECTK